MKKQKETVHISYQVAEDKKKKSRLLISIDGTGLDLTKKEHSDYLKELVEVVSAQLYARANGINPSNVRYQS